jgi:hypothetical protein
VHETETAAQALEGEVVAGLKEELDEAREYNAAGEQDRMSTALRLCKEELKTCENCQAADSFLKGTMFAPGIFHKASADSCAVPTPCRDLSEAAGDGNHLTYTNLCCEEDISDCLELALMPAIIGFAVFFLMCCVCPVACCCFCLKGVAASMAGRSKDPPPRGQPEGTPLPPAEPVAAASKADSEGANAEEAPPSS